MTARSGTSGRAWWQRWFPFIVTALILLLAPMIAYSQGVDSVTVNWTAPGDDGSSGTATGYELRMSTSTITAANFSQATPVEGMPAPLLSGTRQHVVVRGLNRGTVYFFAIKTVDDAGNWSAMSNPLRWDWNLDTSPPSAPNGLSAALDGAGVRVNWSANSEADLSGYTVYHAFAASGPWTLLNPTLVSATEFVDSTIPDGTHRVWYEVTASDASNNESARSTSISLNLDVAPATTAESVIEPGFPNPSRASSDVHIPIVLPASGPTSGVVDVLDQGGNRVRRINLPSLAPGRQEVLWDGKNDAGREVAPGVYRAWLIAGSTRSSIRLVRVP